MSCDCEHDEDSEGRFICDALSMGIHRKTWLFTNEIGNPIRIDIGLKPTEGVTESTGRKWCDISGVKIRMEGPTSVHENHMTRLEAEKLYEYLGEALSKNGKVFLD